MEMGDTGERIDREDERRIYTREITDRMRSERDGDGMHGRTHAGDAAHHCCDCLGSSSELAAL